ncbi:ROK family transcriptional regulator [Rhodococcus globerulus]|uniref:ROK family transcriptional regulator n=1 Tax=Rhodococcus globerulus TaxID=33008 RepID=A0ABU4C3C8_RHOGO|nr:ROK family transcriptional regulator [Rhodococcus globerulus]MDV6271004.1 ROK family transcriptional regulator [Rhodococcus globerulus]
MTEGCEVHHDMGILYGNFDVRSQPRTTLAGHILRILRVTDAATRTELATAVGSPLATVTRDVAELVRHGLVFDRHDLLAKGVPGRQHVPVSLNTENFMTFGAHVGARVTRVVVGDLRAEALDFDEFPTPATPHAAVESVASTMARYREMFPFRAVLAAGLAIGAQFSQIGMIDHARLGWHAVPIQRMLAEITSLPVTVAPTAEALAALEHEVAALERRSSSLLYFYIRETVGAAWALDGIVRPLGSVAHISTGSDVACPCGRIGCLEATVAEQTLIDRAVRDGVVTDDEADEGIAAVYRLASSGDSDATNLVRERAWYIGRAVGRIRDVINPDALVMGGQAVTGFADTMPEIARVARERSVLPDLPIRFSSLVDGGIQTTAALYTSLVPVLGDPIGLMHAGTSSQR